MQQLLLHQYENLGYFENHSTTLELHLFSKKLFVSFLYSLQRIQIRDWMSSELADFGSEPIFSLTSTPSITLFLSVGKL